MNRYVFTLCFVLYGYWALADEPSTPVFYYTGEGSLQQMINEAPLGATIICDAGQQLELSEALRINKALTLKRLNARLPKKLGKTSLIVADAEGVSLLDLELHGNYDSVDQENRAPLILIQRGDFRIERCTFYDSSKDGVEINPLEMKHDIVGGVIKDIKAFRMGRDAVSISGGNFGQRVRDVTIENVSLKKGYLRGAVEISDGTENIQVRGVYAEDCLYAIDVQDHRGRSAPNTNIHIEDVTAVNCQHAIRTANSPRGHTGLVLKNFTAEGCERPLRISHTTNISIEGFKIMDHQSSKHPPLALQNCQQVTLNKVRIESKHFTDGSLRLTDCASVRWAQEE